MLFIRSLVFNTAMYVWMAVIGIGLSPIALVSRDGAYWIMKLYCKHVMFMMRVICNIRVEIRGEAPIKACIVCSKHQSFLDILILGSVLPRFKFIMKKSLVWAPVLGLYALRIGAAPVNRGKGAKALDKMTKDMENQIAENGQIVIYPQGTRVAPGVPSKYKIGAGSLYNKFQLPCIPAATNVGVFWGRNTFWRYPGVAILEFLPEIPAGLTVEEFMEVMPPVVEEASNKLLPEGFTPKPDNRNQ